MTHRTAIQHANNCCQDKELGVGMEGKNALTGELEMLPDGEFQFQLDQMVLIVGKQPELDRLRSTR